MVSIIWSRDFTCIVSTTNETVHSSFAQDITRWAAHTTRFPASPDRILGTNHMRKASLTVTSLRPHGTISIFVSARSHVTAAHAIIVTMGLIRLCICKLWYMNPFCGRPFGAPNYWAPSVKTKGLQMLQIKLQTPKEQGISLFRLHSNASVCTIAVLFPSCLNFFIQPNWMRKGRFPAFLNICGNATRRGHKIFRTKWIIVKKFNAVFLHKCQDKIKHKHTA